MTTLARATADEAEHAAQNCVVSAGERALTHQDPSSITALDGSSNPSTNADVTATVAGLEAVSEPVAGLAARLSLWPAYFAEELDPTPESAAGINLVNDEEDVRWIFSFLSVDSRKTYCLYEAPSIEAIQAAAVRAGLPADVVTEVQGRVMPDGILAGVL